MMADQMRLDRFLTEMGAGSRSQVKELARKGRVAVNGQTVRRGDQKIDPGADQVAVDGTVISYVKMEYYMLNKPQGVVSATEDRRYPTVTGLIKSSRRTDLFPVGRLDLDTEGLLLITNDGELAHRLLSPKKHVDKVYCAKVEGTLPADCAQRFQEGLVLKDGCCVGPAKLTLLPAGGPGGRTEDWAHTPGAAGSAVWALLTIQEGKFHQVKRMFEAVDCRVVYLKRLSMGPLRLDTRLAPGEYRPLTAKELESLGIKSFKG